MASRSLSLREPAGRDGEQDLKAGLEKALAALEQERARRRALERAVLEAAGKERRRLAQELHDTVCQSLSGIELVAGVLVRKFGETSPDAARQLARLAGMIHGAVQELHILSGQLQPAETGKARPAKRAL